MPDCSGLVKPSPSLEDLLCILKYWRDILCPVTSHDRSYGKMSRDENQKDALNRMKDLMEKISNNIWKCFHISDAMHPYSQNSLLLMYRTFAECALLPTLSLKNVGLSPRRFVSLKGVVVSEHFSLDEDTDSDDDTESDEEEEEEEDEDEDEDDTGAHDNDDVGDVDEEKNKVKKVKKLLEVEGREKTPAVKTLIAVDDIDLFKIFLPHLSKSELLDICWIDSCAAIKDKQMSEFETVDIKYVTQDVQNLSDRLLQMPPEDFHRIVSTLPVQTFYAPRSTKAFFKFLDIPTLSTLVSKRRISEEHSSPIEMSGTVSTPSPSSLARRCLKALLEIAQCIVYTDMGEMNCTILKSHLLSIFSMTIVESTELDMEFSLDLGSIDSRFQSVRTCRQSIPYYLERDLVPGSAMTLLLSRTITEKEVLGFCIDLISNKLELQIALIMMKQPTDLMIKIRTHMMTYAKDPYNDFPFKSFDIERLPPNIMLWSLNEIVIENKIRNESESGARDEQSVTEVESEVEDNITPEGKLRKEAFLRMAELAKNRTFTIQPKAVNASASANQIALSAANDNQLELVNTHMALCAQQDRENHSIVVSSEDAMIDDNQREKEVSLTIPFYEGQRCPIDGSIHGNANGNTNGFYNGSGDGDMKRDHNMDGQRDNDRPIEEWEKDRNGERGLLAYEHDTESGERKLGERAHAELCAPSNSTNSTTVFGDLNRDYMGPNQGDWGRGISEGTYDPNFATSSSFSTSSASNVVDLLDYLNDTSFDSNLLAQIAKASCDEECTPENIVDVMLTNNSAAGRVGEYWVSMYLQSQASVLGFKSVKWMNCEGEKGLPFDIEIELINGTGVKYCEVKTRSFNEDEGRTNRTQWFISQREIEVAIKEKENYFAVCLSMSVDRVQRKIGPRSVHLVGIEDGLSSSLFKKEASLLLQVNGLKRTGTGTGTETETIEGVMDIQP